MGIFQSSYMYFWPPVAPMIHINSLYEPGKRDYDTDSSSYSSVSSNSDPGDFDYYVLSLSYAPEFCKLNPDKSKTPECSGDYNLVLHGLWPQYNSPRTIDGHKVPYPQFCKTNIKKEELLKILTNIPDWQTIAPEYQELIIHEWTRHGSCSGLSPEEYFLHQLDITA